MEKILRKNINIKGKKLKIYLSFLLLQKLDIVPIIAKMLHGKNVAGIFQR